jgi:hypothetical protein
MGLGRVRLSRMKTPVSAQGQRGIWAAVQRDLLEDGGHLPAVDLALCGHDHLGEIGGVGVEVGECGQR